MPVSGPWCWRAKPYFGNDDSEDNLLGTSWQHCRRGSGCRRPATSGGGRPASAADLRVARAARAIARIGARLPRPQTALDASRIAFGARQSMSTATVDPRAGPARGPARSGRAQRGVPALLAAQAARPPRASPRASPLAAQAARPDRRDRTAARRARRSAEPDLAGCAALLRAGCGPSLRSALGVAHQEADRSPSINTPRNGTHSMPVAQVGPGREGGGGGLRRRVLSPPPLRDARAAPPGLPSTPPRGGRSRPGRARAGRRPGRRGERAGRNLQGETRDSLEAVATCCYVLNPGQAIHAPHVSPAPDLYFCAHTGEPAGRGHPTQPMRGGPERAGPARQHPGPAGRRQPGPAGRLRASSSMPAACVGALGAGRRRATAAADLQELEQPARGVSLSLSLPPSPSPSLSLSLPRSLSPSLPPSPSLSLPLSLSLSHRSDVFRDATSAHDDERA